MTSTRSRRGRDVQAGPGRAWPGQGRRRRRRRRAGPRDGDVPQPGGLGSAAAAAGRARGRRQRPGGAVQLPHLPGSLPSARGHRQLRTHVSAPASGRPRGRAPLRGGLCSRLGARGLAQRRFCPLGASIRLSPASCPPARPGLSIRSPRRQTGPTCSPARSLTGSARGR